MFLVRFHQKKRIFLSFFIFIFVFLTVFAGEANLNVVYATVEDLPVPGQMLELSHKMSAPMLRALRIDPKNPLNLEFIVDMNDANALSESESSELVSYFLAVLTTPQENIWVNLSPYEKDRIIENSFSQTDMGRQLLAQDYILKQITSSLTNPETDLGKSYWQAKENKEVDLSKIWIMPDQAEILEHQTVAIIKDSSLKVQAGSDLFALESENTTIADNVNQNSPLETLLPAITKEINNGENFAKLRQVYSALILGLWFKKKFENSFYKYYIDQSKIKGIEISDEEVKHKIYNLYREAFDKGTYQINRKERSANNRLIKKRYFSGGFLTGKWMPSQEKFSSSIEMYDVLHSRDVKKMKVVLSSSGVKKDNFERDLTTPTQQRESLPDVFADFDKLGEKLLKLDVESADLNRLIPVVDKVLHDLALQLTSVEEVRAAKNLKNGPFQKHIVLEWTSRDGQIDKLVRDNILKTVEEGGYEYKYHIADADEYKELLVKKVYEEFLELNHALRGGTKEEQLAEAADLKEVLLALKKVSSAVNFETLYKNYPFLQSVDYYLYNELGIAGKDIDDFMMLSYQIRPLELSDLSEMSNWMNWVLGIAENKRPEDLAALGRYFRFLTFFILIRNDIYHDASDAEIEEFIDSLPKEISTYNKNAQFKDSNDMNIALEHLQSLMPGALLREKVYVDKKKINAYSVGLANIKDYLAGKIDLDTLSDILGTKQVMMYLKPSILPSFYSGELGMVNESFASIVLSLVLNRKGDLKEYREYLVDRNSAVDQAFEGEKDKMLVEIKTSRLSKEQLKRWKNRGRMQVAEELTVVIFDDQLSIDDFAGYKSQFRIKFLADYVEKLRDLEPDIYKPLVAIYNELLELRKIRYYSYNDFDHLNKLNEMLQIIYWNGKENGWNKKDLVSLEQYLYQIKKENYDLSKQEKYLREITEKKTKKIDVMQNSSYNPVTKKYFKSLRRTGSGADTLDLLNTMCDVGKNNADFLISRLLYAEFLIKKRLDGFSLKQNILPLIEFYSKFYDRGASEEDLAVARFFLWTILFKLIIVTDVEERNHVISDLIDDIAEFMPREQDMQLIKQTKLFKNSQELFDRKIETYQKVLPMSFGADKGYGGMPLNKKRVLKYMMDRHIFESVSADLEEIDEMYLKSLDSYKQGTGEDVAGETQSGGVDWTGLDLMSSSLSVTVDIDIDFDDFGGFHYQVLSVEDVNSVKKLSLDWIK